MRLACWIYSSDSEQWLPQTLETEFPSTSSDSTYQFVAQFTIHRGHAIRIGERLKDALWRAIHCAPRLVLVSGWSLDGSELNECWETLSTEIETVNSGARHGDDHASI